jgi:hypothetical protein
VAPAVAHVQQVWAFGQDQFDQFKVWLACPSSIVENSSAVVVSYLDRYLGLMHEEGDNIKKSSAACHVQKALTELVAAFQRTSTVTKMSELLNILCFDCGDNLGIVGVDLLISILREETLYAERVMDFHVDALALDNLHHVLLRTDIVLILDQHSSW